MSWSVKSIDDITEVVTKGTTPSTYGMPFTDEGINFVKAEALNGDVTLDRSGFTFINDETHEKLKRSKLQQDDVLVTIAGANVGKCGYVRPSDVPANTNQAVGIVRVKKEEANPRYIYYHFKNPSTFAMCQGIGGGQAAQPNINLTMLKGFKVNMPDLESQNRIVGVIGAYDDLIENNKRRIELLEESARHLYKEWFVRFRFPGHEHVKIIDGVPEGWTPTTLGAVATTNALSHKAKELPEEINYIDISSVSTGRILTKNHMTSDDAPGRARRISLHGDVIWSNVRPNLRAYALVLHPEEIDVFSTGFTVLSGTEIPYSFLYNFTTTDNFVNHLVNHTTGASYPAVRPPDFERAELLLPPQSLLEQFHEICEPNFELCYMLSEQNVQLAAARDLLLPKLMNGEIEL